MNMRLELSGDWAQIAPGVRIRGVGMPNEEDMALRDPVLVEVQIGNGEAS